MAALVTFTCRVLSVVGGPVLRTVVVTAGAAALVRRGRSRESLFLLLSAGGAGGLTTLLKRLVDRPRPGLWGMMRKRNDSFPSGHASGSVSLTGATTFLVWQRTRNRPAALVAGVASAAASIGVGLSRIYLKRHRPGDVLAGYALGGLWLTLVIAWFARGRNQHPATPRDE
jgi:undecaprenyl-diphosphatase